ncbi:GAF domain-containing protein [Nocardia mangyaensis]|uniref:GAF domain-containing protein n=1 Tax=Nocardia mangyaensis TaxID=2213200 RepID=UPI0026772A47|nr:GAF domain-containing protein [Nocardia mangyaensis]MDO3650296.1 DUF5593 domain-containing protein [Nocardia mangyaensis]
MTRSAGDWWLVETLDEDLSPTLVAVDAQARPWTDLARLRRKVGQARAGVVVEVVRRCRAAGAPVRVSEGELLVVAEPVFCAFGGVHGVQLWVGAVDAPVLPKRAVAAWDWAADTELAYHGPDLEELVFARDPAHVRVIRTPPDAFGRMVRFDGRIDYFTMVARIELGGHWQGQVDMLGDDERVRRFQMIARAVPKLRRISGLMHAIPDDAAGVAAADPDMVMLRAVSQHSGVGVGIIELSTAMIYEWAGPPLPPLDRWAVERPTVDPRDLAALQAACVELARNPGASRRLTMRVCFSVGGWVTAQAELVAVSTAESGHGLLRVWSEDPASTG